jgi:hypothetical protein
MVGDELPLVADASTKRTWLLVLATVTPVARFPRIHLATNPLAGRSSHKDVFRKRD